MAPDREKQRRARRDHYYRNTEHYKAYARQYAKGRRSAVQRRIRGLKDGKVCQRCGFTDVRAFDFHHRDGTQKRFLISQAEKHSWKDTLAEIAKCDLICANCHRIDHANALTDGVQ